MGQDSYDLSPLITRAKEGDKEAFVDLLVEFDYEQVIRTVAREYVAQIPGYEEECLFRELVAYAWQGVYQAPVRRDTFDRWLRRTARDNCRFILFRERFTHGDGEAFQPYEYLVRKIINTEFARVANCGYADDVVQDVMSRVWKVLPEFRKNAGSFTSFLRKTTEGYCLKIIKTCITGCDPLDSKKSQRAMGLHSKDLPSETLEDVQQAIRALPEKFRKPVVLKECLELRHREISEILDIPRGTSQVRVQRGKSRLKTALKTSRYN